LDNTIFCFRSCTSLSKFVSPRNSHLKEIHGFDGCSSLEQIKTSCSTERIQGFNTILNQEIHDFTELNWNKYYSNDIGSLLRYCGIKEIVFMQRVI